MADEMITSVWNRRKRSRGVLGERSQRKGARFDPVSLDVAWRAVSMQGGKGGDTDINR